MVPAYHPGHHSFSPFSVNALLQPFAHLGLPPSPFLHPNNLLRRNWAQTLWHTQHTTHTHTDETPVVRGQDHQQSNNVPFARGHTVSASVQQPQFDAYHPPAQVVIKSISYPNKEFLFTPLPHQRQHEQHHLTSPELISLICNLAQCIQTLLNPQEHGHHIMSGIINLWSHIEGRPQHAHPIFYGLGSYAVGIVLLLRLFEKPTSIGKQLEHTPALFDMIRFYTLSARPPIDDNLKKLNILSFLIDKSTPNELLRLANMHKHQADFARRVAQSMKVLPAHCEHCIIHRENTPIAYRTGHTLLIAQQLEEVEHTFRKTNKNLSLPLEVIVTKLYETIHGSCTDVNQDTVFIKPEALLGALPWRLY